MPLYDYNTDPVLQQISALSTQQRADAQSGAMSLRKQLAIDYGDTDYARSVLGDENTAQAAANNPNSVRAQLSKSYTQGQGTLDEALNKANLFYGGERIKQQGNLTQNYQSQLAGATGKEQGALGDINSNLTSALSAADARDQAAAQQAAYQAQQEAMQQALLAALANQYAPVDYGSNDGGGGGGGPSIAPVAVVPGPAAPPPPNITAPRASKAQAASAVTSPSALYGLLAKPAPKKKPALNIYGGRQGV
jgi:hypothetical protein